jgi:hypothetical protein
MTALPIRWSIPAQADLRAIPWRIAGKVDAAVMQFAASGKGDVTVASPGLLRLRVAGCDVLFAIDETGLYIGHVYRRR